LDSRTEHRTGARLLNRWKISSAANKPRQSQTGITSNAIQMRLSGNGLASGSVLTGPKGIV
jgi:hypothetical protein